MAAKEYVLVDTCFLIDALRNNAEAKRILAKFTSGTLCISEITAFELLTGCNTIDKRKEIEERLKSYNTLSVTREVMQKTKTLIKRYARTAIKNRRPMRIPDSIIAANAAIADMPILTSNKVDFEYIKEISLHKLSKTLK